MSAALAWVASEWPQVRPNLEASLLWWPIQAAATLLGTWLVVRWHTARVHRHIEHATGRPPPV